MSFGVLPAEMKGELITLRPLRVDDFEALFECASDPLIWEQHPQSDRYKREVFRGYFDGAIASNGALLVLDNQSGRVIGCSRYYDFDAAADRVTIGYTDRKSVV